MKAKVAVKKARFVKNSDGTVKDILLKVVWGKTLPESMTWEKAKEACDKLGKGWRLPTVNELFSLVDRKKYGPAINTEAFPDTKSSWYWTNEEFAGVSGCAWVVYFSHGYVISNGKSYYGYVRPVRSGQ